MKNKENKIATAIEDVEKNHNWCWANEIDYRNSQNLDNSVLFYRGSQVTYREFMTKSDEMVKSLKACGFKKGDEVPICMSNTVELVMLLRAISLIGAKAHIFGEEFDQEYLTEIIDKTNSRTIFITDNKYVELKNVFDKSKLENIVTFSLADYLPNGIDPYIEYDFKFYDFKKRVDEFKKTDLRIVDKQEFMNVGKNIDYKIGSESTSLDDVFLITYTSGSTNATRPKAICHTNGSLIFMGRFHDPDLSGLPATRHIRNLAHIPSHSNTDIITSISDSLMQNCEVALEPIYHPKFFIYSLMINNPNFAPATRSSFLEMCKMYNNNPEFKEVKFKELYIPTIVGEPNTPGEEKYINDTLKKAEAGVSKVPRPISPVVISIGGGDCEHGGLYFTLYKKHMEKLNKLRLRKNPLGLTPFNSSIDTVCLGPNGEILKPGEYGILAANSKCTMKEYKDNPEATLQFFVSDCYGRMYGNLNVYGTIDQYGTVHMKGRYGNAITLSDGKEFPLFIINDLIAKDTKHVLSTETVVCEGAIVAHVEQYPGSNLSDEKFVISIMGRLKNAIPKEVLNQILIKIRTEEKPFPLTGCLKRNNPALIEEGLTDDLIKCECIDEFYKISRPFMGKSRIRQKQ